jgi:hypothetical protein
MSDAHGMLMRSARRRSLLAAGSRSVSRGLAVGAVAFLGAALCHRFVTSVSPVLAALLLLAPLALTLATSWHRRPAPHALAAAIDRHFATRSLVSAAWATRADPLTPAARIVLADANARARELHAQIATLWPLKLPATLSPGIAAVLAAMLLLMQPGAPTRLDHGIPPLVELTRSLVGTPAERTAHKARSRDATRAPAAADGGSVANETVDDAPRADVVMDGDARTANADSSAGDAPGRAVAAPGVQAMPGAQVSTRWQERARLAGGGAAGSGDAERDVQTVQASENGVASMRAAQADQRSYEPVLAPALAAYVSAAARESRR